MEQERAEDEALDQERWAAVEEATELLVEGDHAQVLALLRDVIAADAGNAYAYRFLGTALFELERYEAARDAYRRAVVAAPHYLGARIALVHALRLLGDGDGATAAAREAHKLAPDDADVMFALGLALAARGERREAARMLERFLGTHPEVEVQLDTQGIIDLLHQEPDGVPLIWQ